MLLIVNLWLKRGWTYKKGRMTEREKREEGRERRAERGGQREEGRERRAERTEP